MAASSFIEDLTESTRARIEELRPEWEKLQKILSVATDHPITSQLEEADTQIALLAGDLEVVRNERDDMKARLDDLARLRDRLDSAQAHADELQAEITEQRARVIELEAVVDAQKAELSVLRQGFGGKPPEPPEPDEAPKPELESADKAEDTPEHVSVQAPEPSADPAPVSIRRRPRGVTLEEVRDVIRECFRADEEFGVGDVKDALHNDSSQVNKHVRTLYEQGTLGRTGGIRGRYVRYYFIKPDGSGPTTRPRGELLHLPGANSQRRSGQGAVPGTGKPEGPAAKPGQLKRQQAAAAKVGRKIKPKRVGGVRL